MTVHKTSCVFAVCMLGCLSILPSREARAASAADLKACEQGNFDKLQIAACTRIINNRKESVDNRIKALFRRAWAHAYTRNLEAAYADASEAVRLDPNRADSYDKRAHMLSIDFGEIDRPIEDYTAAIKLDPTAYRYAQRGDLYKLKDALDLSMADFRQAIALLNFQIAARPDADWNYRSRSEAYRNIGDIDNALRDFNEYLKRKKDSYDPPMTDRGHLFLRKADFDRAIADYTVAIEKNPDSDETHNRRALAYRLKGDTKRAIADYDHMIQRDAQNPESFLGRGLAYVAAGKPERAAVDFTKAIDLFPEDPAAFYNRAQAARASGNYQVAIGDYNTAIELNPRFAVAFNSRGRAYLALNDTARAFADFNEAIRLDDKFAAAYCNRGLLHQAAGRVAEAIADFGEAIAADPAEKDFLIARAAAFAAAGSYNEAERDFTAALALAPLDARGYVGRAAARQKLNALAKGVDDANRALLLDGSLVAAYTVRADINEALGQPDNARTDRQSAERWRTRQEESRRAAEIARNPSRIRIKVVGDFPKTPPFLKMTFKLDAVFEIRNDEITYKAPGMQPYKIASGDKLEETFPGLCSGKPGSDRGTRTVMAAVDKYLVHVDLKSRLDFRTGACRGRHNYYKESFLIDVSDGGCKFTYQQDRDLFGVGAFDNHVRDQACVVEPLK